MSSKRLELTYYCHLTYSTYVYKPLFVYSYTPLLKIMTIMTRRLLGDENKGPSQEEIRMGKRETKTTKETRRLTEAERAFIEKNYERALGLACWLRKRWSNKARWGLDDWHSMAGDCLVNVAKRFDESRGDFTGYYMKSLRNLVSKKYRKDTTGFENKRKAITCNILTSDLPFHLSDPRSGQRIQEFDAADGAKWIQQALLGENQWASLIKELNAGGQWTYRPTAQLAKKLWIKLESDLLSQAIAEKKN